MCTQFTSLAESNDFRHILQCEHGTIHLTWDLVTLYLNWPEFEHMVSLLEQGTRMAEPSKLIEAPCMLVYKKEGVYQLWIRNVAVNLTPLEFLILVDLVRVAFQTAQSPLESNEAGELAQVFRETVEASASVSFSIN